MIAGDRGRRAALSALYQQAMGQGAVNVLLRGAAVSFTIGVMTRFISFPVSVVLARSMGVEEFGVFTYVGTWASLLLLVGLLGFDSALKRFIAAYRATDQPDLLAGVLRRAYEVTALLSLLLGVGLLTFTLSFQDQLSRSLMLTLIVASFALPIEAVQTLQVASLVALKRFGTSQTLTNLAPSIFLAAGVGAVYLVRGDAVRSYEVYGIGVIGTLTLMAVGWVLLRRALPPAVRGVQRRYRTREWIRISTPMLLVDGIRELMNRSDIILIGLLLGTTPAGIYLVALNLARFTSFGLQATTTASLPLISELYALGKHEELQRMFSVACWAATLASGAIAIAVLVLREPLLGLFGGEFAEGAAVLTILIVGRAVDAWTGPNGSLLNMTGHQDSYAVILGVTAVLNAVLTYPAVLFWGIEGAAVVTGFSLALKNLLVWVVVRRRMGMNASIFGRLPLRGAP